MEIRKIVITGGPCAGKTTGMSWIQNQMEKRGWTVLFVPETATELISGGVCPWTTGTNLDYQKCQVKLQLTKEELFEQAARTMPKEKILIFGGIFAAFAFSLLSSSSLKSRVSIWK